MNGKFKTLTGQKIARMETQAFNLEDEKELDRFLSSSARDILVPKSNRKIKYDPLKRIGVGVSKLGTETAVSLGAYAFALNAIDNL